jgi:ferritin-like metal-binding protein YciE
MKTIQNLKELFTEQARCLYSAERQKLEAFPKLRAVVSSPEAKEIIANHIEETKKQIKRLDNLFAQFDLKPAGVENRAMEYLLSDTFRQMEGIRSTEILDIAVIDSIQQINHYTIAGYGNVAAYAEKLEYREVCDELLSTLEEEVTQNQALSGFEKHRYFNGNGNSRKNGGRPFP